MIEALFVSLILVLIAVILNALWYLADKRRKDNGL